MPRYLVEFTASADKALQRLPIADQRRLVRAAESLGDNPRPAGCVKLEGDDNAWRIRVGHYRILYEIHDRQVRVLVVRVGHRKDIYRKGK